MNYFAMTSDTQGATVRDIIPKVRVIFPRFDVVSLKAAVSRSAHRASVATGGKDSRPPRLVFDPPHLGVPMSTGSATPVPIQLSAHVGTRFVESSARYSTSAVRMCNPRSKRFGNTGAIGNLPLTSAGVRTKSVAGVRFWLATLLARATCRTALSRPSGRNKALGTDVAHLDIGSMLANPKSSSIKTSHKSSIAQAYIERNK